MSSLLRPTVRFMTKSLKPLRGPSGYASTHKGGFKLWRNIAFFLCFPAIGICMINCYIEHSHEHIRPEFIPYEHLRLRNKRFHWGDGNKTFFHNQYRNALPEGYETDD